jgi:cbb3-type cytochrome oxidase maturation protein
MYFPYFASYILIGFVLSLLVFLWALSNGQFRDQQRARFLPLEDEPDRAPAPTTRISRLETWALAILAVAGLLASAAILVYALING